MDEQNPKSAEQPIFRALLTPYRSLSRKGFIIVLLLIGLISLMVGLYFLSLGAWPVFGFFGLDVLAIYIAFRLSYRSGRAREEVTVTRTALDILKVAPSGKSRRHLFNPFWAKFSVSRHDEIGITTMAVTDRGKAVLIGGFLNPDDRESFARAFSRALATARG